MPDQAGQDGWNKVGRDGEKTIGSSESMERAGQEG